jgi:hypothetical protein
MRMDERADLLDHAMGPARYPWNWATWSGAHRAVSAAHLPRSADHIGAVRYDGRVRRGDDSTPTSAMRPRGRCRPRRFASRVTDPATVHRTVEDDDLAAAWLRAIDGRDVGAVSFRARTRFRRVPRGRIALMPISDSRLHGTARRPLLASRTSRAAPVSHKRSRAGIMPALHSRRRRAQALTHF